MKDASERYRAWKELLDFSARFALAGMKSQGMSEGQARETFRRRWIRACREHQRANLRVARELHARDRAKRAA